MTGFGKAPLLSRVHPDMRDAQMKVVRHIEEAYNIPVQKVGLVVRNCSSIYHLNLIILGTLSKILSCYGNLERQNEHRRQSVICRGIGYETSAYIFTDFHCFEQLT